MSAIVIRPASHEEWLRQRSFGIGSSDVATILGLNPFDTPYQLWRRKTGIDPPKDENFAMKAGHYLEDAVSRFWQDETDRQVIKSSAGDWLFVSRDKDFMRVSPDRTYWIPGQPRNNSNKGILECKTTQMNVDPDDLPKHWFCQVQYQLGVAGFPEGSLAWLCSGRQFGYRDITFVPDFYNWITEEVEKFWTDNISGGQEPDAVSSSDILMKYTSHTSGKVIEAGQEVYEACSRLKSVREEISRLDDKKKELEEQIKLVFRDAEAIAYDGKTIATWKTPKDSTKFDAEALHNEAPGIYSRYLRTVHGSRRFVLK